MKILFLNAYFQPEITAFSHLENDIIEGLLAEDCEIQVICPVPTRGIDREIAKHYAKRKKELLFDGRVSVQRFWAPKEGKNPLMRAFRYLWCNLREYQIAASQKDCCAIFAASTPPTQGMLGALVRKRRHIPFVYNLQDIFPDSLVNAKMAGKGSLVWRLGRKIEDYSYRNADRIIVISKSFKNNIMSKGVSEEKIVVVPNWIDTSRVYPIPRNDNVLFDRYHLDRSKFYICYSGNLGHSQNLELLVKVAEEIRTAMPNVVFVLIGEGAAKEELESTVRGRKLNNIVILPFQPYENIAHVFSLGDVGLIISKPGIGGSSVPSKTWSIMAAARPLLVSFDRDSELVRIVRAVDCGLCSEADDLNAFITSIRTLYDDQARAHAMGRRGREYVCRELSKDVCTAMYVDVLRAAANR